MRHAAHGGFRFLSQGQIDHALPRPFALRDRQVFPDEAVRMQELLQALLEKAGITADELKDMTAEEMLERIESAVDPEEAVDPETYASLKEKILSDADRIEQYKEEIARQAERIAGEYADTVCLGVGLHAGYGSAQRMYVKRGYIPDGSGVWYRGRVCEPYSLCENGDDLILYLSKKLR